MVNQIVVPLSALRHANGKDTVRYIGREEGIKELAANIKRFGLLVPLLVKKAEEGIWEVLDGNRRLEALLLVHKGDPDRLVEIVEMVDAGQAEALAANVMRQDMNPMDSYEAFAAMLQQGNTPTDIAKAFGKKLREVEQILALAKLAPVIRQKVKLEKITWDAAEALTLVSDHKQQEELLKASGGVAWKIKQQVKEAKPKMWYAKFSPTTYEAAGGGYIVDLFAETTGYAEETQRDKEVQQDERLADNPELWWKLQNDWIALEVLTLKEDGWKDVVVVQQEHGKAYLWPKKNTIRSKKARAMHTVYIVCKPFGETLVSEWVEPDAEAVKLAKAKAKKAAKGDVEPAEATEKADHQETDRDAGEGITFTNKMVDFLKEWRAVQVQEAICSDLDVGWRLLTFLLVSQEGQGNDSRARIRWEATEPGEIGKLMVNFNEAGEVITRLQKKPEAERFAEIMALDVSGLAQLLSFVAAASFDPYLRRSGTFGRAALWAIPVSARRLGFQPDKAFWEMTTKGYMLMVLEQIMDKDCRARFEKDNKAELALFMGRWCTLERRLRNSDFKMIGDEVISERLDNLWKSWIPPILEVPDSRMLIEQILYPGPKVKQDELEDEDVEEDDSVSLDE